MIITSLEISNLTTQEIVVLIKFQAGLSIPNPARLIALANELNAAQLREIRMENAYAAQVGAI